MSNSQGGGWPPGGPPGYGAPPQQGYGPPPQQQGYGPPPQQQGYGPPQQQQQQPAPRHNGAERGLRDRPDVGNGRPGNPRQEN